MSYSADEYSSAGSSWNPLQTVASQPTTSAIRRIQIEIGEITKNPLVGIHVQPDESDITVFHAVIEGPENTPYEGGFFYFFMRLPSNYPWSPPKVCLMTTGNGTVRFNPNLYNNGKVCLSTLGTWSKSSWSPALHIHGVLLSIQSLMNKDPFYNEPGYEQEKDNTNYQSESNKYSENIQYETIRVAAFGMIQQTFEDSRHLPDALKDKIKSIFNRKLDSYEATINANKGSHKFDYKALLTKFQALKNLNSDSESSSVKTMGFV